MADSYSESEEQVNFPFVETASGNLKIVPQQVVYESKQLSIVAANPHRTKIKIKEDRKKNMSEVVANKQAQTWHDLGIMQEGGGDRDSDATREDYDHFLGSGEQNKNKIRLTDEISLATFGFTQKKPIRWENIELKEKADLYHLLEYRINNYMNPDIFIRIGNHEYRCHLLVLQCYSRFFRDVPKGQLEISEKDVSKIAFTYIYDWMLHKGPDSYRLLDRDNVLEIFMASQYLQIKELEEQCWAFIDNEDLFNENKAFVLYLDAQAVNNRTIMELMVPRIQRFFLTLVASKNFLELNTHEVMVFLSSNYICVHAEMEVFMSAVRWLLYDWGNRKRHAVEVMSCIRFGLIEPKDLVDIQRNRENKEYQLVTDNPLIASMIEDGLAYTIVKYWNTDRNADYEQIWDNLELNPPMPRNWAGGANGKNAPRKYEDFLTELHKYKQVHMKAKAAVRERNGVESGDLFKRSVEDTASNYGFRQNFN